MALRSSNAPRGMTNLVVVLLVVATLVALGGTWFFQTNRSDDETDRSSDTWVARTSSFDITIPASGELAARSQREIASQLEVRAVINDIVDEGTYVQKGDVLIKLDDEEISERIKEAELAVDNAAATLASARSALDVRKLTGETELTVAKVDVRLAKQALLSWQNGADKSTQQQLELDLQTAEKNFERLNDRFEASKRLLQDEFISMDEFKQDEIELMRARSSVEQARLAEEIYHEYDRGMELERLEVEITKAEDRLREVEERQRSEIEAQERDVANKEFTLNQRQEDLAKAKRQLEMCTITAPQDGLVVYAASLGRNNWRNDEDPPQIGTELRRNRTVIVLPDVSRMVAEVKVNEALAGRIRPGQRAVVIADAMENVPLEGEVLGVGVLAESGGWRDPNRRDYTVRIAVEAEPELGLKPAMRCKAEILVDRVDDSLNVPIQAIFREGRTAYVWSVEANGVRPKPVRVGRASELSIEVRSGLGEGDVVLLRDPRPDEMLATVEDMVGDGPVGNGPEQGMTRGSGRPDRAASAGGSGRPAADGAATSGRPPRGGQTAAPQKASAADDTTAVAAAGESDASAAAEAPAADTVPTTQ